MNYNSQFLHGELTELALLDCILLYPEHVILLTGISTQAFIYLGICFQSEFGLVSLFCANVPASHFRPLREGCTHLAWVVQLSRDSGQRQPRDSCLPESLEDPGCLATSAWCFLEAEDFVYIYIFSPKVIDLIRFSFKTSFISY